MNEAEEDGYVDKARITDLLRMICVRQLVVSGFMYAHLLVPRWIASAIIFPSTLLIGPKLQTKSF